MKLLDLFSGAGGAAKGYQMAGFTVYGVDINAQPRYVGEFVQANALEFLRSSIEDGSIKEYAVIHASPPCQAYSNSRNNGCHKGAPKLIEPVRELLLQSGLPFVIENVIGAPLRNPFLICGAHFGLGVSGFDLSRHRIFESSGPLLGTPCTHKRGQTIGVYGNGTNSWHRAKFGRCVRVAEFREAMGIDWMTRSELSQAIPPAYTEFIGNQISGRGVRRRVEREERSTSATGDDL